MGVKDRGPGGPQDDTTVATEEAIVRQATPASDAASEAPVTAEVVAPVEEVTISSDARETLPMPVFTPVAADALPVYVPAAAESTAAVGAVVVPAPAEVPHVPVSDARPTHTGATLGLSVLAFGGLLAVLREQRGKDRREEETA